MEGYHNASAASNASTLRWPASILPTVATSGTKFSECINTLVACIYFSNRGNKQREIQRAHTRETCAPFDSDVDVCSPSCRGNFNKTTSCTWPRTSSTCATLELQVDSDAADIHSPTSFLPRSIYLRYLFPPTPPSCVYRFLWERTVSIILYTFNFPFLIYSLYLSGGPIPWSK